jgi:hypothetical protein
MEPVLDYDRRGRWNTGTGGLIVTAEGAGQLEISRSGLVVVIWASAGPHLPPLPASWRAVPAGDSRELLVIDFEDRGNLPAALGLRLDRRFRAFCELDGGDGS